MCISASQKPGWRICFSFRAFVSSSVSPSSGCEVLLHEPAVVEQDQAFVVVERVERRYFVDGSVDQEPGFSGHA
jgi:hypothetical protein